MGHVTELGYLGFEVSDLGRWRAFSDDVLGLSSSPLIGGSGLALRMDDHAQRFILTEGPADDFAFAGWQVPDEEALAAFGRHLDGHNVSWRWGSAAEAEVRRVQQLLVFSDTDDNRHEVYHGPEVAVTPFISPRVASPFSTGDGGLGHVVFGSNDYQSTLKFGRRILGQRPTDIIKTHIGSHPIEISFMHVNQRHHSMAVASIKMPKKIHHFMLEVGTIEDVGRAYDRFVDFGMPITQTIGQHPNDKMISFYGRTPSGFEVEFGYGAVTVHDDDWHVRTYPKMSEWGHHSPAAA